MKHFKKLQALVAGLVLALSVVSAPTSALATFSSYQDPGPDIPLYSNTQPTYTQALFTNTPYYIKSQLGNLYLDMEGGQVCNGGNAQLWPLNYTAAQRWIFVDAGYGTYKIKNYKSGRVLSIACNSNAGGTQVWQYDDWNSPYQKWRIQPSSRNGRTVFMFVNVATGQALDVRNGVGRSGTRIQQWGCNYTNAQLWTCWR